MITAFTPDEIDLILSIFDDINDDHSLSFLYSQIGHEKYAYWYDAVYDKLETYSPLTPFCPEEIKLILDALQTFNNVPDDAFPADIRSALNSACRKAQTIHSALSPEKK